MSRLQPAYYDEVTGQFFLAQKTAPAPRPAAKHAPVGKREAPRAPRERAPSRYADREDEADYEDEREQHSEQPRAEAPAKKKVARKKSAWQQHCQDFAEDNGISYAAAVGDPECKRSYHLAQAGEER